MFGIDSAELLIIAIVALVVIGPKDLPKVMRTVGGWIARARGMASHFRAGIDTMIRESELEEMQKKWAADNERIMREHPLPPADPLPLIPPAGSAAEPPAGEAGAAPERPRAPAAPRRAAPRPPPPRAAPKPPPRELP